MHPVLCQRSWWTRKWHSDKWHSGKIWWYIKCRTAGLVPCWSEVGVIETDCLRRLWNLHPWRWPRLIGCGPAQPDLIGHTLSWGCAWWPPEVPSNLNYYLVLWVGSLYLGLCPASCRIKHVSSCWLCPWSMSPPTREFLPCQWKASSFECSLCSTNSQITGFNLETLTPAWLVHFVDTRGFCFYELLDL